MYICRSAAGPSPRVRGSRPVPFGASSPHGSIPACAGKPASSICPLVMVRVHPRVCGEASRERMSELFSRGPSPRVRGSLRAGPRQRDRPGSIPACAGKPCGRARRTRVAGVHPRVCGEAWLASRGIYPLVGPSPRVRGSRAYVGAPRSLCGSIPACAGKPTARRTVSCSIRVHPRVCGEARRPGHRPVSAPGPSPRVRGSP